jgi:hypothetical protein
MQIIAVFVILILLQQCSSKETEETGKNPYKYIEEINAH